MDLYGNINYNYPSSDVAICYEFMGYISFHLIIRVWNINRDDLSIDLHSYEI